MGDDLSDFEDIFQSREKLEAKENHNDHFDNLELFLDGFDDEELEIFLDTILFYILYISILQGFVSK